MPEASPAPVPTTTATTRPRRRRRRRRLFGRPRSLRDRLLSENLRISVSLGLSVAVGTLITLAAPQLNWRAVGSRDEEIPILLLLLIIVFSLYSLLYAALIYYALNGQPRARLVGTARLPRARKHVPMYRWIAGRSGASSEVLQLLITAGMAIMLLMMRPEGIPVQVLLALTVAAVATAWIGAVMTFAVEYIAEDAHGDSFTLSGTLGQERTIDDYVYASVVIQSSSGPSDLVPLTTSARRVMRNHVILAHVTSTILLTLGVSALLTALV